MNVGLYWCKNIFESDWNDFGEHSCRIHEFLQHFFSREISPMLFLVELKWNRFAWRIIIDLKWTSEFKMAASMIAVGNSISPTAPTLSLWSLTWEKTDCLNHQIFSLFVRFYHRNWSGTMFLD